MDDAGPAALRARSSSLGEGGASMLRDVDWSRTALGPPEDWPPALRAALDLCLASSEPAALSWGTELSTVSNEAWSRAFDIRSALAAPAREAWAGAFGERSGRDVEALANQVLRTGVGALSADLPLAAPREQASGERWFRHSLVPIRDERGVVRGLLDTAHETTGRVLAERRYRELVDSLPAAIHACDARGRLVLCNEGAMALWGLDAELDPEAGFGAAQMERPGGGTLAPSMHPMARVLRERRAIHGEELVVVSPDGERRHVLAHAVPRLDASGELAGALGLAVDITERKQAEAELAATKDWLIHELEALTRLHDLAMRVAAPVELPDALRTVLTTLVELHGAERGVLWLRDAAGGEPSVAAQVGYALVPPPAIGAWESVLATQRRAVIADFDTDAGEPDLRDAARGFRIRAVHSTPIVTRAGEMLGVLSVHFDAPWRPSALEEQIADLCARHAADALDASRVQRELRDSEERFRNLADAAPAMLWTTDPEGRCTFLSRGWYEFTGRAGPEGLGHGWGEAIHPDDAPAVAAAFSAAVAARVPITLEYRVRRWDGVHRWVIDYGRPRFDAEGRLLGFIGSVFDITERKQAEDALKDADRRKDEFLATLAHELRNPLSPIRNGLQLMRLAGDDRKRVDDAREMMERQLRHMVRLIDDLLDVSRISRGKIELRRQRVDLTTVVLSAVETSRPMIDQLGHELSLDLPRTPVHVDADVTRLAQVFSNLLNNAAKYTDQGGHIRLSVEREDGGVAVCVKDDGVGIPPEMLQRVFDLFAQVDRSLEKSHGGLGIGLTIVKRLVEMHGGWVEARSPGQDRGSEFVVHLPVVASGARVGAPRGSEPAFPAPRRRVLVVDDNRDSAVSLAMLLQVLGHEVGLAYDGEEALATAAQLRPEIVLLDLGMPKLSGYQVCERMRQQPWGREALIVAVTGWGQQEDRRRSHEAGFDHHLVKPLDPSMLSDVLSRRISTP